MRRGLLGLLFVAAAGLVVARRPSDPDPPPPAPVVAPGARPVAAPPEPPPADASPRPDPDASAPVDAPATEPPSPAPGRAFRAEHDNATVGVIDPLPPADAATWTQRRAAADRAWQAEALAAARAFAEAQGLAPAEADAVTSRLEALHATLDRLRADLGAGRLTAAAFRERAAQARVTARADLEAAIGRERADALRAHLAAATRGGGF